MRILTVIGTVTVALLWLTGCTAPVESATPPATAPAPANDLKFDAFLERHDLAGLSVRELIETLDASEEDRDTGPVGSVRPAELVLSDDTDELTVPIPDEAFYLAFAPYREQTHECYNHNLASCRGELSEVTLQVTITDAAGATIVDEPLTTYVNGFAAVWLPRGITGVLTVGYENQTASTEISTGPEDPTCLTTLRLA